MISATLRILFFLIKFSLRNQENIFPILKSFLYFNKRIRVSTSAILILEENESFVLIKNHHREEYYAPIGGVHKHSEKLPQVLHDIEWSSDYTSHEPKKSDMKNDIRGIIVGHKLADFLDWFTSRKGREGDQALLREFDEELFEGKVGKTWRERASKAKIELVRRVIEGPRSIDGRPYQAQFRYFEIYTIDPNCKEGAALRVELISRASRSENNLALVTKKEILSGRIESCRSLIAGHAKYYFSSDWHGNEPSPY